MSGERPKSLEGQKAELRRTWFAFLGTLFGALPFIGHYYRDGFGRLTEKASKERDAAEEDYRRGRTRF